MGSRKQNTKPQPQAYRDPFAALINANNNAMLRQDKDAKLAQAQAQYEGSQNLLQAKFAADQEYKAARLGLAQKAASMLLTPAQKEILRRKGNDYDISSGFKRDWTKGGYGKGGTGYRTSEAYQIGDSDTKLRMDADAAKLKASGRSDADINNFIMNNSDMNTWGTRWLQGAVDYN